MLTEHSVKFYPVNDRESAIRNMGGLVWLYDKHLAKFKDTYADSPETITNLLMGGNTEDARILVHSVKGLAGTLGLTQLYYAASVLEKAIVSSAPTTYDFLEIYRQCLCEALLPDIND